VIAAPTFSQIKAQVSAILQRSNGSPVIGIHAQGRWTGDRQQFDGNQCYVIDQCDSPLALRIALQQGQQERATNEALKDSIQVIVTPLPESELAEDILIRLVKQRLFTIDSWQIVKSLFRAKNIDPRLIQHQWLPEVLMDWVPPNHCFPVMGGFLDAEVVWPLLLDHGLGLDVERPDLPSILHWSTDSEHVKRYQQAPQEFRTAAGEWLASLAGPAVKTVLHGVEHNQQPDALPLGLAATVVYHPEAKLDKAIGKFEERFLSGLTPEPHTISLWSDAAQQALKSLPVEQQHPLIQRSDTILTEIGAADLAHLSACSELGFTQLLTTLSKQLITHIQKPSQTTLEKLLEGYQSVRRHYQAALPSHQRRLQRMDMAMRLAQWLVANVDRSSQAPKSLEDAIADHVQEGGFLDWARLMLPVAEPHRDLSTAYGKLFDAITAIREEQSHQFAQLLKDWTAIGSTRKSVLTVEQILETVVAPLAATNPVLLIVMDGMSFAVAYELLSDLTQKHWQLITPHVQNTAIGAGLAVIPSETKVSRASLLCGTLTQGQQNQEKKGFSQHPALLQHCKRSAPPRLFHKDALQSITPPVLSGELYNAIESEKNQVIGLVLNAVDDLLSKGDQVDIAWTCDRIKVLEPILQAAHNAERLVVLTSDHGHVLHHGTQYQSAKGGERWRVDDGNPQDGELQISGERVIPAEGTSIIAPWTEKRRYSSTKKNGYHGGITPQEMLVPIAVLATSEKHPQAWQPQAIQVPQWWNLESFSAAEATPEPPVTSAPDDKALSSLPLFSYMASADEA
jgi:hypothetical protein